MLKPQSLKQGDTVAITCPAKSLDKPMIEAIQLLQSWGLQVLIGQTLTSNFHQFAGSDDFRAQELQNFINNHNIKAIFAARGGYGCIRIVDRVDFSPLLKTPKWLIGFSDITVLHCQLQSMGLQSIHGQMPATIAQSSTQGLESLKAALFGQELSYAYTTSLKCKPGNANGVLVGGNLSILVSILNSVSDVNFTDKILFLEDVGEYYYAIDRMMYALDRAGKLAKLKGLIVGGFTNLKDNPIPFGFTAQQIIYNIVKKYDYPVAFDFPAGHIDDNRALIFGGEYRLKIYNSEKNGFFKVKVSYQKQIG